PKNHTRVWLIARSRYNRGMNKKEFEEFELHPQVMESVTEAGYETPTPIQEAAIPSLLKGRDVLGIAQTGTGKTAAYALPMLHTIEPGTGRAQALVVVPVLYCVFFRVKLGVPQKGHVGEAAEDSRANGSTPALEDGAAS
ncbi:MAG: DEAD/DEAH box helicase, partial [Oceanidesulfovibrio sp.]